MRYVNSVFGHFAKFINSVEHHASLKDLLDQFTHRCFGLPCHESDHAKVSTQGNQETDTGSPDKIGPLLVKPACDPV